MGREQILIGVTIPGSGKSPPEQWALKSTPRTESPPPVWSSHQGAAEVARQSHLEEWCPGHQGSSAGEGVTRTSHLMTSVLPFLQCHLHSQAHVSVSVCPKSCSWRRCLFPCPTPTASPPNTAKKPPLSRNAHPPCDHTLPLPSLCSEPPSSRHSCSYSLEALPLPSHLSLYLPLTGKGGEPEISTLPVSQCLTHSSHSISFP